MVVLLHSLHKLVIVLQKHCKESVTRKQDQIWAAKKEQNVLLHLGYWPSVRLRMLDIGQVPFLCVYGQRRSARVVNHSAGFESSSPLKELAM